MPVEWKINKPANAGSDYENPMLSWLDEINDYLEENPRVIVQFLDNISSEAEALSQEGVDLICEYASCKCNRSVERVRQKIVKALYKQNKVIEVVVAPAKTLYNFYKNPWDFIETGLNVVKKVLGVLYGPVMAFAEFTASLVKEIARLAKNLAMIVSTLPPQPVNPKVNFNKFHIDIGSIGMSTITEDPSNLQSPEEMFPLTVPVPFSKEFFQAIGEYNRQVYREKPTYITGTYAERVEGIPVRSTITEGDTQQYWGEGQDIINVNGGDSTQKYWGQGIYSESELLSKPSIINSIEENLNQSGNTISYVTPSLEPKETPSYSSVSGNKIAKAAENVAGTTGYCLRGVKKSLKTAVGYTMDGLDEAWKAADALRGKSVQVTSGGKTYTYKYSKLASMFTEVQVPRDQLSSLPKGSIVVWDKSAGHKYGHIAIAMGNGMESSDHIQKQTNRAGVGYTVFLPNEA